MKQEYEHYTKEDLEVWKVLFERQVNSLKPHAVDQYYACLDQLKPALNSNKIPDFNELNEILMKETGWSIEVVPGMIPVDDFFKLLAEKKFCSSTWLRKMNQLDYLEEPDMFHDIFGHIPLLMDQQYANFVEQFGQLGLSFINDKKILSALQRLYWYTIEFGLLKGIDGPKIYGAGIISSYGETKHIYQKSTEVINFDIDWIFDHEFINSEIQNVYVEIPSFRNLYTSFEEIRDQLLKVKSRIGKTI